MSSSSFSLPPSSFSPPPSSFIPYGRQSIDDDDIAAVVEVLRSDWLTSGPAVEAFEKALAEYCGARHAVAVSSGTAALHLALLAARLGRGDRVLTSAITFLASANCAEFVGATADFADIDPETYNVSPDALKSAWRDDVRAVVTVDLAGQPCEARRIAEVARPRGALIIEDGCHAIGSELTVEGNRYHVGGHPWADMTTFSFHPVKTLTTGEGGAVVTNDEKLAKRCRLLRNHGMTRNQEDFESAGRAAGTSNIEHRTPNSELPLTAHRSPLTEFGPWYYEMQELGYNYRLTDIQCALGLSQLKKINRFTARRQEIVEVYNRAFASLPYAVTPTLRDPDTVKPAWHLYILQIDFTALRKTRTRVMQELKSRGVGTQVHYIPVHLQPYYREKYGYAPGKCPLAEAYYEKCLSLPLFPAMSDEDVSRVIQAVREVCRG